MKATPAQERYLLASDAMREALKTGAGPEFISDDDSEAGYLRWKAYHDLLDTQKDLLNEIDALVRRFDDARPYIEGGNGYFNNRGIVAGAGSKIDVLCALFDVKAWAATQAEIDYMKEQES